MQWIEVNVAVTHEAVEAVADMLTSIGSKGVAIEDPQLINDLRNSGTWELCDIPEQENTEVLPSALIMLMMRSWKNAWRRLMSSWR